MARAEVLELLGPPESSSDRGEGDRYYLGPSDSALPLDGAWLVLRFGGDGCVTEWTTTSD
ncbi:MAG: hypothetical protein HZA52_14475 [Planctomycetes bacterium]|nr:hypothetical protein [Planctomycetota bacterium]